MNLIINLGKRNVLEKKVVFDSNGIAVKLNNSSLLKEEDG